MYQHRESGNEAYTIEIGKINGGGFTQNKMELTLKRQK
jgi:hypothetical protein